MDSRGWNDIGYNFLIGEDGRIYEGNFALPSGHFKQRKIYLF